MEVLELHPERLEAAGRVTDLLVDSVIVNKAVKVPVSPDRIDQFPLDSMVEYSAVRNHSHPGYTHRGIWVQPLIDQDRLRQVKPDHAAALALLDGVGHSNGGIVIEKGSFMIQFLSPVIGEEQCLDANVTNIAKWDHALFIRLVVQVRNVH